jgi:hypothetical protein
VGAAYTSTCDGFFPRAARGVFRRLGCLGPEECVYRRGGQWRTRRAGQALLVSCLGSSMKKPFAHREAFGLTPFAPFGDATRGRETRRPAGARRPPRPSPGECEPPQEAVEPGEALRFATGCCARAGGRSPRRAAPLGRRPERGGDRGRPPPVLAVPRPRTYMSRTR